MDVSFTAEEVENAIRMLKRKKSAGPDGLTAEHLQEGGSNVRIWLRNILNAIVEMEVVPAVLKSGVVVPIYKGGGRDPVNMNSYRGVTVSSVIAKLLESLVLGRMSSLLEEAGVPHVNQSAYRKKVSCADRYFCHSGSYC